MDIQMDTESSMASGTAAQPPLTLANKASVPSASFSYRAPSPPFIHIPTVPRYRNEPHPSHPSIDMMPSYEHVDSTQLTSREITIITRNVTQIAMDRASDWSYGQRREAQPILDFLFLGPTSFIRNHDFLRHEGITMLLVIRDARLANRNLLSVDKAVETLGIHAQYLDIETPQQLIKSFSDVVRAINDHLLTVYHSQAQGRTEAGQMLVEAANFRRGKVLVTCETGNDRSAAIVAAYIMAMFRNDMIATLQFVNIQRFCCTFTEETKQILLSWQDILQARFAVAMNSRSHGTGQAQCLPVASKREAKRGLDDMMDISRDQDGAVDSFAIDRDRFAGRDSFVPFVDINN